MNSMKSDLNLRLLALRASRTARICGIQTSILGAAALCAALLTAPLAFAATRTAKPASPDNNSNMAPAISPEEAAARHQVLHYAAVISDAEINNESVMADSESKSYYGTWTAHPYSRKFLVSFVAYNDYCQEVTSGYWTEGSLGPRYGKVTQSLVKGKLLNGACSRYIYTGAGIYYEWVHQTGSDRNDEFKANWHGAGLENKVTFYLKDRY